MEGGGGEVGRKKVGFVVEEAGGGLEGFLHVAGGVEGFDVEGGVVGEVGMSSRGEVLYEVVGVLESDGVLGEGLEEACKDTV